ncbi:HAD family hydrolase [Thermogladius sp. 4427co]|uniref:HAD family hydrolase n=1 Tax=Thermogladius sp. 4427co TaxID=3450718 RepID=UPI003F792C84
MREKKGLIVFDCDGVLTDSKNSWGILHEYFGSRDNRIFAEYYRRGLITYEDWMKIDIALMIHSNGGSIKRSDVLRALSRVRLREDAREVVQALREKYHVAVVSSGVGDLVGRVCDELGIRLCYFNELKYVGEELVPGGVGRVPLMEKDRVIESLAGRLGYDMREVVYVGDDVWDILVFEKVGYSIAVEPCGEACSRARSVVKNLREIIQLVDSFYDSMGSR